MTYLFRVLLMTSFGCFFLSEAAVAKPWDAERYARCIETDGEDQLSPFIGYRIRDCRYSWPIVEKVEGGDRSDIEVKVSVAGRLEKDSGTTSFKMLIAASNIQTSSRFGGVRISSDQGGHLDFIQATMIISGVRTAMPLAQLEQIPGSCTFMSRGAISGTTCKYVETTMLDVADAIASECARLYAEDRESSLRIMLSSRSGVSVFLVVPTAQFVAMQAKLDQAKLAYAENSLP